MIIERNRKLLTLLSLYIAQSIPMSFFSTVVPVIMRQEQYSLEAIGLMQLIKLPWIIKFLWAPLVDRTGSSTNGYRRWIFFSEGFYAFSVAVVAFFSLEDQFSVIIVLVVLAIFASATQDIATDAWAILTLKREEQSMGNSMQSIGSFLGSMVGSGVLLIIYHYLGWRWLLLALSALVVFAVIPLVSYKPVAVIRKRPRSKSVSFKDIGSFFKQEDIWPQIFLLAFFHSSLMGIMTMIKPMMIDLGYSVREIGIISGIHGTAAGALFAFLGGFLMRRFSRSESAFVFASINLLPSIFFFLFGSIASSPWVIWSGVALLWGAYAGGMVFVFTIAMDRVRHCLEGTDFTLQIVIVHISSLILSVLSGKIAGAYSYNGLFVISFFLGVLTLATVYWRFRKKDGVETEIFKESGQK